MVVRTLGELTKEYRKANRLSMRKFAESCGLSKSYMSILENNWNPTTGKEPVPSLDVILAVAKAMNADPFKVMKKLGLNIKPELEQQNPMKPEKAKKVQAFEHIPVTRDNLNAALKEGRILILPFRAFRQGDTVYVPHEDFGAVAHSITKVEGGIYEAFAEISGTITFNLYDVGHKVFTNRADAINSKKI